MILKLLTFQMPFKRRFRTPFNNIILNSIQINNIEFYKMKTIRNIQMIYIDLFT